MGETSVGAAPDATGRRFALVVGRYNPRITVALEASARAALLEHGAADADVRTVWVPGVVEIALVAQRIAEGGDVDALLALGAVVRGDTPHFDYVAQMVADGVMCVMLDTGVPVSFGVLTVDSEEQATARISGGAAGDKGREAALTAIEMVQTLGGLS